MREEPAPALYTVEEAARVLRIGRTKAYAMTREWRATGGRSGLPVVDFGHVLRVPRAALEQLLGVDLTNAPTAPPTAEPARVVDPADTPPAEHTPSAAVSEPPLPARSRARRPTPSAQLDFSDAAS